MVHTFNGNKSQRITLENVSINLESASEVWERIINFISHFIMDLIAYPCWVWGEGNPCLMSTLIYLNCVMRLE